MLKIRAELLDVASYARIHHLNGKISIQINGFVVLGMSSLTC